MREGQYDPQERVIAAWLCLTIAESVCMYICMTCLFVSICLTRVCVCV